MTRVVSVINQKGGVGKTTVCTNLADALVLHGKKVLLLDVDPQGHAGQAFGIYRETVAGMFDVFNKVPIEQCVLKSQVAPDVVPAGEQLYRLESVQMKAGRGLLLKNALANDFVSQYDFVLIDCPPSSGFFVVNAIAASKELVIPVTADYFGLSGVSNLMKQIKRYESVLGLFENLFFVVSRFQRRTLSLQSVKKLTFYFKDQVAKQMIFERAVLAESSGHGQSVLRYAPTSKSATEFMKLAEQFIANEGKGNAKQSK